MVHELSLLFCPDKIQRPFKDTLYPVTVPNIYIFKLLLDQQVRHTISKHCASRLITVREQLQLYKSPYTVNQGTDMSCYAALFAFTNLENKDLTTSLVWPMEPSTAEVGQARCS